MADSLADDDLKLVAYTIVFAKRGGEAVMPRGSDSIVVTDNLTERQFVAQVIADYTKRNGGTREFRELIARTSDLRYLKVHYVVSRRWPREPAEDVSRQTDALEQMAEALTEHER
jgi:hypothetical protein